MEAVCEKILGWLLGWGAVGTDGRTGSGWSQTLSVSITHSYLSPYIDVSQGGQTFSTGQTLAPSSPRVTIIQTHEGPYSRADLQKAMSDSH